MSGGSGEGSGVGDAFGLWGARFSRPLAPEAERLNRSLPVDGRLWREEVEVDAAWLRGLVGAGILSHDEADRLVEGLDRVAARLADAGPADADDEDVHTLVERLLGEEVGQLAGRLRTGRSRNDQIATVVRLWTLRALDALDDDLAGLQAALLDQADATVDTLMPAYTHLQRAQPIRMAHYFLSHFWPLARDRERLREIRARTAVLPLGSGAVAGTGYPVDRAELARALGFDEVSPNSMDAVSDRDHIVELCVAAALIGVHLSRLAEDLILFASAEFGLLRFDDAYSTGSSLMPQKRNPDIAELARGKSAGLLGHAVAALTLLKGLPTGYNRDLQEDKTVLFAAHDALRLVLPALAGAVGTLEVNSDAARVALDPSTLAVDVADALVRAGVPFHDAHDAVGALSRRAGETGRSILELDDDAAGAIHPELPGAVTSVRSGDPYEQSVERRAAIGGTARAAVEAQLESARDRLVST